MNSVPWLSLLIFTPWIGALVLACLPGLGIRSVRTLSLAFSLSTLGFAIVLLKSFDVAAGGFQFSEHRIWIGSLHVHSWLGLDGLSLLLVLLTAIIAPAGILASWRQASEPRFFALLYLTLQGCALGVFLALDFVQWFLFWELSLVPAFFLIRGWGGTGAGRAAHQFIVYTLAGSAFMLAGFAALYATTGTFDLVELARLASNGTLGAKLAVLGGPWPKVIFLGVFLGVAVKVPLFPFHTWLPSAYAEAPTGVSMFLTAVMSKMGVYGFLRIVWPLFPVQLHDRATALIWLALAGIVLGGFSALRQTDLKRMVAYSSINHVSYCLLALFAAAGAAPSGPAGNPCVAEAMTGALLQVFNHGISAAALFFCVGVLESRAGGKRGLDDFGGVRTAAPIFAGLCGLSMFSSLGLPGLNGFVGEFLIFLGVSGIAPWAAAIASLGLLVTALFLLTFWQRVFHGPVRGAAAGAFADLSGVERAVLVPLAVLMVAFGFFPQLLIGLFKPLIVGWANHLGQ